LESYKEMIIEPNKEEFKKEIIKQMIEHIIYGWALQNKTGEFAAKMIAMKSAKDNSIQVNDALTIKYNKTRQWVITQEISEIVSAKVAIWD
jgi:F-type H+-transporting ATPase subunit gamma